MKTEEEVVELRAETGVRAWLKLMRTYRQRYGCRSIRQIVTRFAPPSENNTAQYIQFCCRQLGLSADVELTGRLQYALLGVAMAWFETRTRLRAEDVLEVMKKYDIRIIEDGKRED